MTTYSPTVFLVRCRETSRSSAHRRALGDLTDDRVAPALEQTAALKHRTILGPCQMTTWIYLAIAVIMGLAVVCVEECKAQLVRSRIPPESG